MIHLQLMYQQGHDTTNIVRGRPIRVDVVTVDVVVADAVIQQRVKGTSCNNDVN